MHSPAILALALILAAFAAPAAASSGTLDDSQAESIAELQALVADLALRYDALTNTVRFIEEKCNHDDAWRKAYHGPIEANAIMTNEYGIVYKVEIHRDGYTYANYKTTVASPKDPEQKAKDEANQKALLAKKKEEALQAMEKAQLPRKVAEIYAERRKAKKPIEKTVVIEANPVGR